MFIVTRFKYKAYAASKGRFLTCPQSFQSDKVSAKKKPSLNHICHVVPSVGDGLVLGKAELLLSHDLPFHGPNCQRPMAEQWGKKPR